MKTAFKGILVTFAWIGLLAGNRSWADDWQNRGRAVRYDQPEVVPRGTSDSKGTETIMADSPDEVVGEVQPPAQGMFGDTAPGACEFCGGGGCMPATWTLENSIGVIALTRANNRPLATNSLPGGPFPAASSGTATNQQYLNDVPLATFQPSALEIHTLNFNVSPTYGILLSRFLGRDGEGRDHFLEIDFTGLSKYSDAEAGQGSIIPHYVTTPFATTITPVPSPIIDRYYGSLLSQFPIIQDVNGNQQGLATASATPLGENYEKAFNRTDIASASYVSSFNNWELNYVFAGHNQPDQLVMHPNGRWYRQCQSGYYYNYFFGARAMVIDEKFDYATSGNQFGVRAVMNPDGTIGSAPGALMYSHRGTYGVRSFNTLLGLQTGGTLEYRFCRWAFETHSKVGAFMNFAREDSHITTTFGGPTPPTLSDGSTATNTDVSFTASNGVVAFAGGFGVAGSYKFLPNLVGHVSYDMLFVGDLARAPEQMNFSLTPEMDRGVVNTKGAAFYNGFTFGMEMDW